MALSAVVRTGQRFGAAHIVSILRGEGTAKVGQHGHDRLPTFGVGDHLDRRAWQSVLRQLVAAGLLAVDVDGYGGLRLADGATEVLRGERQVSLRHDPQRPTRRERRRTAATEALDGPAEEALFEALRDRRMDLAKAQGVPPYVVFHDSTLLEIATRRPATEHELLAISGVGRTKLERYGADFLAVVRAHGEGAARPGSARTLSEEAATGEAPAREQDP
jgi:ATP-dependent DNA helicase RecQ